MVNDGSIDGTGVVLDNLAYGDCRIKVIHKNNGGVSSARNAGLDVAQGEWVTFVDADDLTKPDTLETLYRLTSVDCDIVFAGFEIYRDGKLTHFIPELKESNKTSLELAKELFAPSDYSYQGYICSKLYRREIIKKHNIRFNGNIRYNEDRLFTFTFLSYARKGAYTTKPVYEYYLHGGNAMSAIEGPNYWKFETDLDAFIEMTNIAPKYNSSELLYLVRLGAIASYKRNRNLNKRFGGDSRNVNRRLKCKLRSAVPLSTFLRYLMAKYKAEAYSRINHLLS